MNAMPVCFVSKAPNVHGIYYVQAAKAAKLDKFEIPAKIKLMSDLWTPESGLVTAALKIKREQLKAKFKDELQQLYA